MAPDDDIPTHSVQPDMPASPNVETREETVARVMDEVEAASVGHGGSADPSTRRGVLRTLSRTALRSAALGAIVGAALALILWWLPGPREEGRGLGLEGGSWWQGVGYVVVLAIGGAVIFGILGSLWALAREDGRVEREVEEKTGQEPEGPGRPSSPGTDLPLR